MKEMKAKTVALMCYLWCAPLIVFCVYQVRGDSLSVFEYAFVAIQLAWCMGPLFFMCHLADKESTF